MALYKRQPFDASVHIGKVLGSYIITEYCGYLSNGKATKYNRHYFIKTCRFCSNTVKVTPFEIEKHTTTLCVKCKETYNIHTTEKKCCMCQQWLPATPEYFPRSKNRVFGIHYQCKPCKNLYTRTARHTEKGRTQQNNYVKTKELNDPIFRLKNRIRTNIKASIKRFKSWGNHTNTAKALQCDWKTFKEHIESRFLPGMTWENHGEWHFDHIVPINMGQTFDEVVDLCYYKNYQPLWQEDNNKKYDSLIPEMITPELYERYKVYIDRFKKSSIDTTHQTG